MGRKKWRSHFKVLLQDRSISFLYRTAGAVRGQCPNRGYRVRFAPDWPTIKNAAVDLAFNNQRMDAQPQWRVTQPSAG